jgi:PDZ domain-containing secreted protein
LKENKKSNRIIRLDDNLISVSKDTVLVNATVIEDVQHEQKCQTFYILISKKGEQQVTIRLDPLTDPSAKTDGVKMALTLVTRSILQYAGTDLRVTKTNISDFLQDQKLWQNEV